MKKSVILMLSIVCFLSAICVIAYKVHAATSSATTYCIANKPDFGFTDIDDVYAIITDIRNCDMMHATTGVADADYTDCDIEFTQDGQNTKWAVATIPPLDITKEYAITFYETSGTAAATDDIKAGPFRFDPESGSTFTDTNPVLGSRNRTIDK